MLPTPCGPGPISLVRLSLKQSLLASGCCLDHAVGQAPLFLLLHPFWMAPESADPAPLPTPQTPGLLHHLPQPQAKRDTQSSQLRHVLPKEQAQPLLPTEPLQPQGSHLYSHTSQPRDPPWSLPVPYFPSLQNWEILVLHS